MSNNSPVAASTRNVIILQGIPGSGKSHLAREIAARNPGRTVVVSADDFFELGGGTYAFDVTKLGQAHGQCFRRFLAAINERVSTIIVDNTNTSVAEIAPYVLGGEAHGYGVEIIRVLCDPEVAAARNTHGVPPAAVVAMAGRIASCQLPPWWTVTEIPAV